MKTLIVLLCATACLSIVAMDNNKELPKFKEAPSFTALINLFGNQVAHKQLSILSTQVAKKVIELENEQLRPFAMNQKTVVAAMDFIGTPRKQLKENSLKIFDAALQVCTYHETKPYPTIMQEVPGITDLKLAAQRTAAVKAIEKEQLTFANKASLEHPIREFEGLMVTHHQLLDINQQALSLINRTSTAKPKAPITFLCNTHSINYIGTYTAWHLRRQGH